MYTKLRNYGVRIVLLLLLMVANSFLLAQVKGEWRMGLCYAYASQASFPFNSSDYQYRQHLIGLETEWFFNVQNKFRWSCSARLIMGEGMHKMLNPQFIKGSSDYADYLRYRYMKYKALREYGMDLGLNALWAFKDCLGMRFEFGLGSLHTDRDTERLAYGFTFSERLALGLQYRLGYFDLSTVLGVRHVSNANLKRPNGGHNSSYLEFKIKYPL